MTTLDLIVADPATLTTLSATGTIGGVKLVWDIPNDTEYLFTEIWVATSNDRSLAVLATTLQGSSYFYQTSTGNTRYFWIKAVNVYDRNNGAWEPLSSTAGVSATVPEVAPVDLSFDANNTMINAGGWRQSYDLGGASGSAAVARSEYISSIGCTSVTTGVGTSPATREPGTGWDTWYNIGGSSEFGFCDITQAKYSISLMLDWASLSCTIGTVDVYIRIRLRNITDSVDIDSAVYDDTFEMHPLSWKATDTVVRSQPIIHWHTMKSSDIPADKNFELLVDVKKVRSDASSTLSIYWERLVADITLL